jgi:hypothetical protein
MGGEKDKNGMGGEKDKNGGMGGEKSGNLFISFLLI